MGSPLVTVVTPSYNQGRFIRATIESVLSQDYPNLQYIIMDGGSTDETAAVVSEYGSRLTWISEKDRGQSHAINKGFRIAKGEIVSWLNSDDFILPRAVRHAVTAFENNPRAGAVYGEGYLIDERGSITGRFPATVPFNLWKMIYLSDYILQQTSYFRKSTLDEVGYVDENLHWGMDWDLYIRIGKRYPIQYIPEYMGCLREYQTAKTFSGGGRRFRELASIMRRHGSQRYPPGYVTYGLDTYGKIWTEWIERLTPSFLERPSKICRHYLFAATRYVIDRTLREAQGWYTDGWATTKLHYMLPSGGQRLRIEGSLPNLGRSLQDQRLDISCQGSRLASLDIPFGEFAFSVPALSSPVAEPCGLVIRASKSIVPQSSGISPDSRRLAYMLKSITWG
jgi:glycosyltransferase involved in cell wall biosynthesis